MVKHKFEEDSMTVQELIDELMKVEDKYLPVTMEGCDCWGYARQVGKSKDGKCIELRRDPE